MVGYYESPTHFSRDYSRKFGISPSRDAQQNRPVILRDVPETV